MSILQYKCFLLSISVLLFSVIITIRTENIEKTNPQDPCVGVTCTHGEDKIIINSNKCSCNCSQDFTGDLCQYDDYCQKFKPCLHGGKCISLEDGTYYCDCKIGFLDPHCEERDPCILEGKTACHNGATCARKSDFDYLCQCRLPFEGEHCEAINLCDIDPGECIDDISTMNGNCYPCPVNSTCEKLGRTRYNCLCPDDDVGGVPCEGIEESQIFEIPDVLKTYESGKFLMQVPFKSYDGHEHIYIWYFGDVSKTPPYKVVSPRMLTSPTRTIDKAFSILGKDIKEYNFKHHFRHPGFYPVTVFRIDNTSSGNKTTVVFSRMLVVIASCTLTAQLKNVGNIANFSDAPIYETSKSIFLSSSYNISCEDNYPIDIQEINHTWILTKGLAERGKIVKKLSTNNQSVIEIKPNTLPPGNYNVSLNISMKYKRNMLTTLNGTTSRPELSNNSTTGPPEMSGNITTGPPEMSSNITTGQPEMPSNNTTGPPEMSSNIATSQPEIPSNNATGQPELPSNGPLDLSDDGNPTDTNSTPTGGDEKSEVTDSSIGRRSRSVDNNDTTNTNESDSDLSFESNNNETTTGPDFTSTNNDTNATTGLANGNFTSNYSIPDLHNLINSFETATDQGYFVVRDPYSCVLEDGDSPLIPIIVGVSLALYTILLLLFFIWRREQKIRPLIVSANIKDFQDENFYLLTLKTGNRILAGSSANIVCRLYGEKGRSKLYVLQDCKLDTAERGEEDNFLISSPKDLGDIRKINLWHDNTGYFPSWYCLAVIIRELKTDKYWHFLPNRRLSVNKKTTCVTVEVDAATKDEIRNYYYGNKTLRKIWDHVKIHHIWMAPFFGSSRTDCFTTPERLTVAMTLLCCYFFFAILMYGLTRESLRHQYYRGCSMSNFFRIKTIIAESLKTVLCAMIGFIFTILFTIFRQKRIPTLLVWKNRAVIQYDIREISKNNLEENKFENLVNDNFTESDTTVSTRTTYESNFKEDSDEERWDNLDPNRIMVVGVRKKVSEESIATLMPETEFIVTQVAANNKCEAFRIPSTDMLETKIWISETLDDSHGPVDVEPIDLVHTLQSKQKSFAGPDLISNLGLIGGITSLKDDIPASFVYKTNSGEDIVNLIEKDIHWSYVKPESQWVDCDPEISTKVIPRSKIVVDNFKNIPNTQDAIMQTDLIIKMSKTETSVDSEISKSVQDHHSKERMKIAIENFMHTQKYKTMLYVELCEMDCYNSWLKLRATCYYLAWIMCIAIIIIMAALTIYFGRHYGKYHSINWFFIVFCGFWLSFFILQPLKILFLLLVKFIFYSCMEREPQPPELRRNKERFQVYCVNGLTVLPKMYTLKYQIHNQDLPLMGPLLDPKTV